LKRFDEIVTGVAQALGCKAEIELVHLTPAVINDPQIASHVQTVAARVLPGYTVVTEFSTMGSEDMAYMMQDIPGCYIFIGSSNPGQGLDAAHHHPRFDFDERALPAAAALMTAAAIDFLKPPTL